MTTTLLSDTFARANQSGWGTASDGNVWTQQQAGPTLSIASNEGVASGAAAARAVLTLGTPGVTNGVIAVRFDVSTLANEADIYLVGRFQDVSNYYWIGFNWINSTTFNLAIRKRVAGVNTTLTSSVISPAITTFYWIKAQLQGNVLSAKFWQDGSAEPASWTITANDSALTTGTLWGLAPFTAAAGATVNVDHLSLTTIPVSAVGDPLPTFPHHRFGHTL